jgi:hypothetical protein
MAEENRRVFFMCKCSDKDIQDGKSERASARGGGEGTEENRTKQNRTDQNRSEQNKTKQNKTKQNRTEQNKTRIEQNKTEQKEQSRIEQNRTEQNRTGQDRTEEKRREESAREGARARASERAIVLKRGQQSFVHLPSPDSRTELLHCHRRPSPFPLVHRSKVPLANRGA